jgi:hypothetical protein
MSRFPRALFAFAAWDIDMRPDTETLVSAEPCMSDCKASVEITFP